MEIILNLIWEYLWESFFGLLGFIVLGYLGYKKISKSNSQNIIAIGSKINIKQTNSDEDTKK